MDIDSSSLSHNTVEENHYETPPSPAERLDM